MNHRGPCTDECPEDCPSLCQDDFLDEIIDLNRMIGANLALMASSSPADVVILARVNEGLRSELRDAEALSRATCSPHCALDGRCLICGADVIHFPYNLI